MPVLSDKELESAIYWEAEQYIPVPLSTITLDYKILHRPATPQEGNKMAVLLVGAPTILIDKYEKILALAGLTINAIETEILSVIRAVVLGDKFPSSIIINIGATSTSLAIVRQSQLSFVYSLPTGGNAITRAIGSAFGFSLQQAEEYKKIYGLTNENLGGKIGAAAQPVLSLLVAEIRKAMAFYAERYPTEPIQQAIIAGGGAKLPGFTTFLTNAIGIETIIANPWKILVAQEVPKDIIDNASSYSVAVGLAMR
jgi:type IV pilus assembly protein PilM